MLNFLYILLKNNIFILTLNYKVVQLNILLSDFNIYHFLLFKLECKGLDCRLALGQNLLFLDSLVLALDRRSEVASVLAFERVAGEV